jgi:hypothetical protein
MEDLEGLLQKLEDVFQSFRDPSLAKKSTLALNNDAVIIGQVSIQCISVFGQI